MHYLSAFLDTEIDVHVKVVETKNFMGKVFKPSKIVRHKARIVDLYDLFSEIPVTMIGVVEIFLKDSCMDVDM